jgi:glycosyltransferase involved in cell wall biosynthesis
MAAMSAGAGVGRPLRIGLISVSAIADDPRVRRQGDLFWERGWDVVAVGLSGARSQPPEWLCLDVPATDAETASAAAPGPGGEAGPVSPKPPEEPAAQPGAALRLWRLLPAPLRRAMRSPARSALRLADIASVYLRETRATASYWRLNDRYALIYRLARDQKADIWLANDWSALPIVQKLAAEQGVPYAYDTHELAIDEYAQRWRWRVMHRPVIAAVERMGIAGAVATSCVSQGIADRLQQVYGLPQKPLLIRNMPRYQVHPHRPTGETIEVLYHGVVYEGRGLEACIDSVALWRPEFRLTIRGPAPADYREALAERIRARGLGERVVLAPPVPMIDLVKEAARFDVGLFALPGHSKQNMHVLPNKFFEYTMAGLALCVSDLPEMTALLRQHDLGRLIPEVTPQAIAAAVNGFDRAMIEACKQRALEAAKVLNWEAEADRLFAAIAQAAPAASPARSLAAQ